MGPAALWTQHAYQAELQHPGAITQHSHPCGQECCPSLGPVRMGQGCSHTLPTQDGPPILELSLGAHPVGLGAETTRLLFGFFFSHCGIGEMEKLLWGEDGQKLCLKGGVGTE